MSLPEPTQVAAMVFRLAELGYRLFPLTPGQKTPLVNAWQEHATSDAEQLALWLSHYPTANWAIATDGLIVIDVDPGAEDWPTDENQARDLATTPVIARTPRGGRHYYFRQPEGAGLRNTQDGQLADHVDTRADGGYVACAPSVVNGKAYAWVDGEIDCGPAELPTVPAWIVAKLAAAARQKKRGEVATDDGDAFPEGRRNGSLTRLAGAMRRVGADCDAILSALRDTNARRCKPPLDDTEVETIARSVSKYAPGDVVAYLASLEADDSKRPASPDDPGPLPADLLNVPGFVADVMAFNLAGAHKPQPVLALAGALSLLATLTGRKITDTQGTRTNLYCIGVAETSTGKERAREVNKELLYHAGLPHLIGSENFGSAQGLVQAVAGHPAILFQVDELGRYLKTISESKDGYLRNIINVLLRMFTSSASIFISDAVTDTKKVVTIQNPHACLYGTSTPDALFDSFSLDSLQDGFLSRVLVFEGDNGAAKRWIDKPKAPLELVEQLRFWGTFSPPGSGNLATQPLVVETTAAARRIMYEYDGVAQEKQDALGKPLGSVWPRAVEKANKMALLFACSENPKSPIVTDAAALWATSIVTHLTDRLVFIADRNISENRIERGVKRLARIVESAGPKGITKGDLTLATRWAAKRDREEYIDTLIQAGEVSIATESTATKPRTVFIHRTHRQIASDEAAG